MTKGRERECEIEKERGKTERGREGRKKQRLKNNIRTCSAYKFQVANIIRDVNRQNDRRNHYVGLL